MWKTWKRDGNVGGGRRTNRQHKHRPDNTDILYTFKVKEIVINDLVKWQMSHFGNSRLSESVNLWLNINYMLMQQYIFSFSLLLLVMNPFSNRCRATMARHKVRKAATRCCSIRSGIFLHEDNISCSGHSFSSQLQQWATAGLCPSIISWPSARCPDGCLGHGESD